MNNPKLEQWKAVLKLFFYNCYVYSKVYLWNYSLNSVQSAHAASSNKLKHVVNCLFYDLNRLISTFRIEIIVCLNDEASAGVESFTSIHFLLRAFTRASSRFVFIQKSLLWRREKSFQQARRKRKLSFIEKEKHNNKR